MFRRLLFGGYARFSINYFIKLYIFSESFLWSAWSFAGTVFPIFIVQSIPGGSIQVAAFAQVIYLICRVIVGLCSGRLLMRSNDQRKLHFTLLGMLAVAIGFAGFAITKDVVMLYVFNGLAGAGMGFSAPAKNAIFAMHLDHNKESTEWSLTDGMTFVCMALATALGGFIATEYGFPTLFYIASGTMLLAMVPYILYIHKGKFTS